MKPVTGVLSLVTILALSWVLTFTATAYASPFSAVGQFDPNNNPSSLGPWSYGYETSFGGSLVPYPYKLANGWGYNNCNPPDGSGCFWNTPLIGDLGSELILHPGANGDFSVLRFTAPSSGNYSVSGFFEGIAAQNTTTDVHVLVNGSSIFSDDLNDLNKHHDFSGLFSLSSGQTIDFIVGVGEDGNYNFDSTGFAATIVDPNPAPEPGSLLLLLTGLTCLGGFAWRRRGERR